MKLLKKLGPGLLFAGASIGVSHLVLSTKAGADFGLGLVWALLLAHLFKYPFFLFGPRYAVATGESLLSGYKKLGRPVLTIYLILTLATMFTIQVAVTIVTAGIASTLFPIGLTIETWTIIILILSVLILQIGNYSFLDRIIKYIILILSVSTITAVTLALFNGTPEISFNQIIPSQGAGIVFLIAFMGWMPAPLDISIWHSIWMLEKQKISSGYDKKALLFDFNIGYFSTIFLGLLFIILGALIFGASTETISESAAVFASQLITMYTSSLGGWSYIIIGIAAFTTMFSTTLTTLDASPRAVNQSIELLTNRPTKHGYLKWLLILSLGSIGVFLFLESGMGLLIKIATVLSFLTAPFYAIANYSLISSKHTPKQWRPNFFMHLLSWLGIAFLIAFSIWFLSSLL